MLNKKMWGTAIFSPTRPSGPSWSSSCDVCLRPPSFLSPFHVLDFEAYFAPTSRSRMSTIFLVDGYIANFGISLDVFEFFRFGFFFRFQFFLVFVYPWSTLPCYRCYYPHRSRELVSPVCGIFSYKEVELIMGDSVINEAYPNYFFSNGVRFLEVNYFREYVEVEKNRFWLKNTLLLKKKLSTFVNLLEKKRKVFF